MRGAGSDGGAGRPAVRGAWSGRALGAAAGCDDGRRSEGEKRGLRMRHGFLILASRGGAM